MSEALAVANTNRRARLDEVLVALGRRDRQLIVAALAVASAGAWLYLGFGYRSADGVGVGMGMSHSMMAMGQMGSWTLGNAGVWFSMWAVMMVAMMLPSVIPVALVYVAVRRKADRQGNPVAPTAALLTGYIGVWLLFSVAATAAQWGLENLNLLSSSSMASDDARFGAAMLLAAGVYQLTPLKARCLTQCRDPIRLISGRWRPGSLGAVRMGAGLGVYCLGCCWVLMALLFVGGVMNLLWVAAIATFILLEKVAPRAQVWSRMVGVAGIVGGAAVFALA